MPGTAAVWIKLRLNISMENTAGEFRLCRYTKHMVQPEPATSSTLFYFLYLLVYEACTPHIYKYIHQMASGKTIFTRE